MSFSRSCRRGPARLALFLALGALCSPAWAARIVDDSRTIPIPGNLAPQLAWAVDVGR